MQVHKALLPTLMISMAILGSTTTFAKAYYKWVDRHGSTHYTTTPPPKGVIKKGKVGTYGWKSNTAAAPAANSAPPAPTDMSNKAEPVTAPAAAEKTLSGATAPTPQTTPTKPPAKTANTGSMTRPL